MLKRFIPLALAGPLIGIASLTVGGGAASAACSVDSYLVQTDASQRSNDVECIQATLNDKGYNSGPVDGWFGPVTAGAVTAYQQASGLTVDGQVGRETAGSLGVWVQGSSDNNDDEQQQSAPARSTSSGGGGTVWDRLAQCESGGNWAINTGNGYYGGLQFLPSSWRAAGGSGMPHQASREEQIRVAENLRDQVGSYRPWPACAAKLGLL